MERIATLNSDGLEGDVQIHVILDTNALWKDFALRSAGFGELIALQKQGFLSVYVPEVVIYELSRQARRDRQNALSSNIKKISEAQDELQKLHMPDAPKVDISELRDKAKSMRLSLKEMNADLVKRLQEREVTVLPLPEVDVRSVFERYVSRRKPFKPDKGEGLADDLLWRTVVEHAESVETSTGTRIVFITGNSSDFGKEGALHEDLQSDLSDFCVVELWGKVESFLAANRSHFEVKVPAVEPTDFRTEFSIVTAAVTGYAETELPYEEVCSSEDLEMGSGLAIEGYDLPQEVQYPYISSAEVDDKSVVWDSYFSEDGTELGRVEAILDLSIEGYAAKSDAYHLVDEHEAFISDPDWNDFMAVVGLGRRVRMVLHIRLENEQAEVLNLESLEIDSRS